MGSSPIFKLYGLDMTHDGFFKRRGDLRKFWTRESRLTRKKLKSVMWLGHGNLRWCSWSHWRSDHRGSWDDEIWFPSSLGIKCRAGGWQSIRRRWMSSFSHIHMIMRWCIFPFLINSSGTNHKFGEKGKEAPSYPSPPQILSRLTWIGSPPGHVQTKGGGRGLSSCFVWTLMIDPVHSEYFIFQRDTNKPFRLYLSESRIFLSRKSRSGHPFLSS